MKIKDLLESWQLAKPELLPFESEEFTHDLAEQELTGGKLTIQVLTFIGAWLTAIFFLLFLGIGGLLDSEEFMLVIGVIITAGSIGVSYAMKLEKALESFVLAMGMVGQGLMTVGLVENFFYNDLIAFFIIGAAVEAIILLFTFSSIQRFASTVLIYLCALGIIHELNIHSATHVLVGVLAFGLTFFWVNESKVLAQEKRFANFLNPVGLGIAISVLCLLVLTVNKSFYEEFISYWWLSTLLIGVSLIYLVRQMLIEYQVSNYQWLAYASVVVLIAPTVFAPGIAASILILLLGFFRGHRIMAALGIIGLIGFISMFYYNLQITLLVKSIVLFATGFFFVLVRLGLKKLIEKHEAIEQRFQED